MATFYLLPPRSVLGDHLLEGVERLLPGLDLNVAARRRLTEAFLDALDPRGEVYLVFRDDLPAGVSSEQALLDGYGAEAGDEVIEVRPGVAARRWRVGPLPHFANG
jgi:hypothetical protein